MCRENESLIVAVDGGGTACRARLISPAGTVMGFAESGPANISTDFDAACRNILTAADTLFADAGIDEKRAGTSVACLALAGTIDEQRIDRLRKRLGFSSVSVISDMEASLYGALQGRDGVVASIGTGSFFVSQEAGETRRIGGRGFFLSDDCSGAYLGRELLRETVRAYDGLRERSPLTNSVMTRFGNSVDNLVMFSMTATPRDYGKFAPRVVDANHDGDPTARALIDRSLSEMCEILDALEVERIGRLCLVGGLGAAYKILLPKKYQALCGRPMGDTLDGAAALARKRSREI